MKLDFIKNNRNKIIYLFIFDLLNCFFYIYYNIYFLIYSFINIIITYFGITGLNTLNLTYIFSFGFYRIIKNFFNIMLLIYLYTNYNYDLLIYIGNSFLILVEIAINVYFLYFNNKLLNISDEELNQFKNLKKIRELEV